MVVSKDWNFEVIVDNSECGREVIVNIDGMVSCGGGGGSEIILQCGQNPITISKDFSLKNLTNFLLIFCNFCGALPSSKDIFEHNGTHV